MGSHRALLATRHTPPLTPATKAGTRFAYPRRMEGRVDLDDLTGSWTRDRFGPLDRKSDALTAAPPNMVLNETYNADTEALKKRLVKLFYRIVSYLVQVNGGFHYYVRNVHKERGTRSNASNVCNWRMGSIDVVKLINRAKIYYQSVLSYEHCSYMAIILKLVERYSSSCTHLRATGHSPAPARKADTRLTHPGGMEGWVDLCGWLHTEIVYPPTPTDDHPSKY